MFLDDILLVTEAVGKYGLLKPLVDLGGHTNPIVADYKSNTIGRLGQQPFAHLDPAYEILSPEYGSPLIEELPQRDYYGTALCLSVLEHARDPFALFDGLYRVLRPGGLCVLSTVFEYPYHGAPDYWRFSPDGLQVLATHSHFELLECDWRLDVPEGIRLDGSRAKVKSVYAVMRK